MPYNHHRIFLSISFDFHGIPPYKSSESFSSIPRHLEHHIPIYHIPTITLKTFSRLTYPNPVQAAYRLFIAYLMSPSAVKVKASNPPSSYLTLSRRMMSNNLCLISLSTSRLNRRMQHLLWMASINLEESLQDNTNLVEFE